MTLHIYIFISHLCLEPETEVEVFKPNCNGLPQSCPQPPESDVREIKCSCPTVNCTWSEWSSWSATCGPATRQKTVTTKQVRTNLLSYWPVNPLKLRVPPAIMLQFILTKEVTVLVSNFSKKLRCFTCCNIECKLKFTVMT